MSYYFDTFQIACTGSKYGDFEGGIGLRGIIILLTRLRGIQRRYTGVYERVFEYKYNVNIKSETY